MSTFICLGGMCLGGIILKRLPKEYGHTEIKTPVNNAVFVGGFKNVHLLFDGTFHKNFCCGSPNVVYKYIDGDKHPHQWFNKYWRFPHTDFNRDDVVVNVRERYDNMIKFINNPSEDYWFLYSLNKWDVNLSENDIQKQLLNLSKYIDVNRIIFLGQEKYTGDKTMLCGYPVANNKFENRNDNFRKVVGDRYIVVSCSNVYELATQDFIYNIENVIRGL